MTFVTKEGFFCYRVMPFGLKNANATYQGLVNKIFKEQIGHNVEVYVDDMLVKSSTLKGHIRNLSEAFVVLRAYNMNLNPKKCAFRVKAGKFWGFMVSVIGIEVNPEKIRATLDMPPLKTIKDIQRLMRG